MITDWTHICKKAERTHYLEICKDIVQEMEPYDFHAIILLQIRFSHCIIFILLREAYTALLLKLIILF